MSTGLLLGLDLLAAIAAAAAWLGAGAAAAAGKPRPALGLAAGALAATAARGAVAVLLAEGGWWFVQEKILLALPLTAAAGAAALLIDGPALVRRDAAPRFGAAPGTASFAAGHAAAGSALLPFLSASPLRLGTALLTLAAVGAATLATVHAMSPGPAANGNPAPTGSTPPNAPLLHSDDAGGPE